MFHKKAVFKNLAIFTGKHLVWSLFLYENSGLHACKFIKERLQHRCFPVNIAKFLRTFFLNNICEWLSEYFPTWINNITSKIWSEEKIFSKTNKKEKEKKNTHSKTHLAEKKLQFHVVDHFVFLYFSNACLVAFALHSKRRQ